MRLRVPLESLGCTGKVRLRRVKQRFISPKADASARQDRCTNSEHRPTTLTYLVDSDNLDLEQLSSSTYTKSKRWVQRSLYFTWRCPNGICHPQPCGYAVPLYTFQRHRTKLVEWGERKEAVDGASASPDDSSPPNDGLKGYWVANNLIGMDGLPGLQEAFKSPLKFQSKKIIQVGEFTVGLSTQLQSAVGIRADGSLDVKPLFSFLFGVLVTFLYFRFASSM